jgi:hypothetical protein
MNQGRHKRTSSARRLILLTPTRVDVQPDLVLAAPACGFALANKGTRSLQAYLGPRAQEYPAYRSLHRTLARSIPGFLELPFAVAQRTGRLHYSRQPIRRPRPYRVPFRPCLGSPCPKASLPSMPIMIPATSGRPAVSSAVAPSWSELLGRLQPALFRPALTDWPPINWVLNGIGPSKKSMRSLDAESRSKPAAALARRGRHRHCGSASGTAWFWPVKSGVMRRTVTRRLARSGP